MSWWQWVLVGVAGAVGAPLRYVVDTAGGRPGRAALPARDAGGQRVRLLRARPVDGPGLYHGLSGTPRLVLGTGLVGAYTTFSTFSFETIALLEEGEVTLAVRNVVLSAVVGTLAAAAGLALASL